VGLVRVNCRAIGAERTAVEVTYRYTAVSEEGERFLADFSETAYAEYIAEWETLLSKFFGIA